MFIFVSYFEHNFVSEKVSFVVMGKILLRMVKEAKNLRITLFVIENLIFLFRIDYLILTVNYLTALNVIEYDLFSLTLF